MSNPNSMHNFLTLIKRLEAATSRLEDIAQSAIESPQPGSTPAITNTPPPPPPKAAVAPAPPPPAPPVAASPAPPPPAPPKLELPESVEEYDSFLNSSLEKWVKLSDKLGGPVAQTAAEVLKAHKYVRDLVLISAQARKPSNETLLEILQPFVTTCTQLDASKGKQRGTEWFDHISAVADAIWHLTWFNQPAKPWKHIEEMAGTAQFYGNRVIKNNKQEGGDATQVQWAQALYQTYRDYAEFVKTYLPDGLRWNPQGSPAVEVAKNLVGGLIMGSPSSAAAPRPAGGAPPPPPPPPPRPPPGLKINEVQPAPAAAGGLGAVFSELNQGENVTKGLRKVDKSQMTHKNPSLRASSTVPEAGSAARGKSPAPGKKPKPESMRVKKPPKKELDGNKWIIENYEEDSIEIEVTMSHSVLVTKCNSTTIHLKGKGNAVTVDNCNNLSLIIDSLVSTVDVIKSPKFAMQVTGTIPTVLLDQVDGAQIYLSMESIATKVFSTKTTAVNVNILESEDGDYKEVPLPNQICSYFDEAKGEFVNEIVSHAG